MRVLATLFLAMTLLPVGCASWPPTAAESDLVMKEMRPTAYDYSAYFQAFDNPWVGRSRAELLDVLGPPDAVYEARHRFGDYEAGIPASTLVYTGGIGSSGYCLDAYVVDNRSETVIKYYCR